MNYNNSDNQNEEPRDTCDNSQIDIFKHSCDSDRVITSGESGAAGFAGLLSIMTKNNEVSNELKEILELDENSVVLCINSEGDTDPKLYKEIVKRKPRVIKGMKFP